SSLRGARFVMGGLWHGLSAAKGETVGESATLCPVKRALKISGLVVLVAIAIWVAGAWQVDRPVESLTARWAPPPSQFVELAGLRVHLRDVGPREDPLPI